MSGHEVKVATYAYTLHTKSEIQKIEIEMQKNKIQMIQNEIQVKQKEINDLYLKFGSDEIILKNTCNSDQKCRVDHLIKSYMYLVRLIVDKCLIPINRKQYNDEGELSLCEEICEKFEKLIKTDQSHGFYILGQLKSKINQAIHQTENKQKNKDLLQCMITVPGMWEFIYQLFFEKKLIPGSSRFYINYIPSVIQDYGLYTYYLTILNGHGALYSMVYPDFIHLDDDDYEFKSISNMNNMNFISQLLSKVYSQYASNIFKLVSAITNGTLVQPVIFEGMPGFQSEPQLFIDNNSIGYNSVANGNIQLSADGTNVGYEGPVKFQFKPGSIEVALSLLMDLETNNPNIMNIVKQCTQNFNSFQSFVKYKPRYKEALWTKNGFRKWLFPAYTNSKEVRYLVDMIMGPNSQELAS